jgi:hypothetical protein
VAERAGVSDQFKGQIFAPTEFDKTKNPKKETGDAKSKAPAEKEDVYYSNYFDKEFIKLARGKKMRKGLENTVSSKKAITFEVFKDELELQ